MQMKDNSYFSRFKTLHESDLRQLVENPKGLDPKALEAAKYHLEQIEKNRPRVEEKPVRVSIADEQGDIAAIKTGRAPSLGQGISEIIGGCLVGGFFIYTQWNRDTEMSLLFVLIGFFIIGSALVTGAYHIYNSFSKNRCSAFDVTSPSKEIDYLSSFVEKKDVSSSNLKNQERPLDSQFKPRKYPGAFCPFCSAKVEDHFDYCPACAKDI